MIKVNKIINNPEFRSRMQEIEEFEKNRKFCGHGMDHLMDTARMMYIYSLEGNMDFNKEILYATALLHDIGRGEEYKTGIPHNQAGAMIAEKILMKCGFSEDECMEISRAILDHRRSSGCGQNDLCELLYKADKKSRLCFNCSAADECKWDEEKKNMVIEA